MSITSDDLLQNFFKTGSTVSMPRIDSESQFQEFMRKIPSATNLAAAMTEGLDHQGGGEHQPAGMPRVPSLDFIKAFLSASRPSADTMALGQHSLFNSAVASTPATPSFELNGSVALTIGRAKLGAASKNSARDGPSPRVNSSGGAGGSGGSGGGAVQGPGSPGAAGESGSAMSRAMFAGGAGSSSLPIAGLQDPTLAEQAGAGPGAGTTPPPPSHLMLNPNILAAAFVQSQLGGRSGATGFPATGVGSPAALNHLASALLAGGGAGSGGLAGLEPRSPGSATAVVGAALGLHGLQGVGLGAGPLQGVGSGAGGLQGAAGAGPSGPSGATSSDGEGLGGVGGRSGSISGAAGGGGDSKLTSRRERRMLSNRESARRSRKRKQEHLAIMETRMVDAERDRDRLLARIAELEDQARHRAAELAAARKEVQRLRRGDAVEMPEAPGTDDAGVEVPTGSATPWSEPPASTGTAGADEVSEVAKPGSSEVSKPEPAQG